MAEVASGTRRHVFTIGLINGSDWVVSRRAVTLMKSVHAACVEQAYMYGKTRSNKKTPAQLKCEAGARQAARGCTPNTHVRHNLAQSTPGPGFHLLPVQLPMPNHTDSRASLRHPMLPFAAAAASPMVKGTHLSCKTQEGDEV